MIQIASHLSSRRGCTNWNVFIGWGKGAINKRKERIIFMPGHWGEGNGKGFWKEIERVYLTDKLLVLDQKIPDWLIKITFLG